MQLKSPREKDGDVTSDISLRDLVAPLFRRKRLMWVSFPVLFAVFVLLGLLTTHRFESSMAILVNRERFDPLVTPESTSGMILASNPVTEEEINSEVELLKSSDVLEKVVLANG